MQFVTLQTVFEGFETNNADAAKAVADKFELKIPVGHDPGTSGKRSNVLERYKTQGTPWMIIIDPQGVVRANDFLIPHEKVVELIDKLAKDAADGAGMLKQPFPEIPEDAQWLDKKVKDRVFSKFAITTVRWVCIDSENDKATLASLIKLYKKYKSKKLNLIVAVRPSKEGEAIDEAAVAAFAKETKWKGPLMVDADGNLLATVRKMGYPKDVESPTVLVDWEGNIEWVATADRMLEKTKDKRSKAAVEAYKKLFNYVKKRLTGK